MAEMSEHYTGFDNMPVASPLHDILAQQFVILSSSANENGSIGIDSISSQYNFLKDEIVGKIVGSNVTLSTVIKPYEFLKLMVELTTVLIEHRNNLKGKS